MYKRAVLLMILVFFMLTPSLADAEQKFKDLPTNHWAYNEVVTLAEKGVIGGYNDGTVRPNNPVTREELAKIAFTLFPAAMEKSFLDNTSRPDYPDIYERWSTPSLNASARLAPGYTDGQFKPSEPATRRDVAVLLLYAKLVQDGYFQCDNGILNILLPVPKAEIWNKLQQFKEYADLEKIYRDSARYLESDPDKKQFTKFAGQFFNHLNNVALLVEENIIRGYSDSSLRLDKAITRAETCALARRIYDMDLSRREKFILEPPQLNAVPHTVKCNSDSAHTKMANLGQWYKEKYPHLEERARAIYSFLVFNFTYNWDYRAEISGSSPTSLESTLTTGTGTYVNFANLYAVLAKYGGIEATVVSGKAENPTDSGPHAWVELACNGRAVQVDPTYGICTGNDYFNNFNHWEKQGYKWTEESRHKM